MNDHDDDWLWELKKKIAHYLWTIALSMIVSIATVTLILKSIGL